MLWPHWATIHYLHHSMLHFALNINNIMWTVFATFGHKSMAASGVNLIVQITH